MQFRAAWVALSLLVLAATAAAPFGVGSGPDPYQLAEFSYSVRGNYNAIGKTQTTSSVPAGWAVIVTLGQSNANSEAEGTYTTSSANARMFNIYDGAIYPCANPVLGASVPSGSSNSNGVNCQIADKLITAGTFTGVVMVPIGVGGTLAADWNGVILKQRIVVTMRRLAAGGLVPHYILWHQGEQDNAAATAGAAYTTSVQAVAQTFIDNGSTAPFFVAKETMVANATSGTIQTAQANAVSAPLHILAGADWDSLTTGTNRQAGGTHLTQTGATNGSDLDKTIIINCKAISC